MPEYNSVEWHEENLINFNESLTRKQAQLVALQKEISNGFIDSTFRQHQIRCARAEKKTSFSADRYKIKDKPNYTG